MNPVFNMPGQSTDPKNKAPQMPTWLVLTLIGVLFVAACWLYFRMDKPAEPVETTQGQTTAQTLATVQTAPDFYTDSGTVVHSCAVESSPTVQTEQQALAELQSRGFPVESVNAYYTLDGTFVEAEIAETAGSQQHPYYTAQYLSATGELWSLEMVNGSLTAMPVGYNLESQVLVVISEKDSVSCYDKENGMFYDVVPNADVMVVARAHRIDAATLDTLTKEVLDRYG